MMGFFTRIPQEIVDMIIDAIAEYPKDEECLRSCTLVCKSWRPRSRTHLFSMITLADEATSAAFQRLLENDTSLKQSQNGVSPVAHLVRHLRYGLPTSTGDPDEGITWTAECPIPTLPSNTVKLLRRLDTLSIAQLHMDECQELLLKSDYGSIRTLYIHSGKMLYAPNGVGPGPSFTEFIRNTFPNLEVLHIGYEDRPRDVLGIQYLTSNVFRITRLASPTTKLLIPSSLRTLSLGVPTPDLIGELTADNGLATYLSLRSLAFLVQPTDDPRSSTVMKLLGASHLTSLSIGLASPWYYAASVTTSSFVHPGACTIDCRAFSRAFADALAASPLQANAARLRTLRVEGCDVHGTDTDGMHDWVPALLAQVDPARAPVLERVTFAFGRVRDADSEDVSWIDWAEVLRALGGHARHLVVVVEVRRSEVPRAVLYERFARLLPPFARRDHLQVRCFEEVPREQWIPGPRQHPKVIMPMEYLEALEAQAPKSMDDLFIEELKDCELALTSYV